MIGAGYAGLAAAVQLAGSGHAVTMIEANRTPGGRARRVEYRGALLDNGQHLLLGAYASTLDLMKRVGVADRALVRTPLTRFASKRVTCNPASTSSTAAASPA